MTTPTIEAVSEAPAATAAPAVQTYELEALGRDIAARIKKGDKAKAHDDLCTCRQGFISSRPSA